MHNRQPQTQPAVLPGRDGFELSKQVEDSWLKLRVNSDSVVAYFDDQPLVTNGKAKFGVASIRCIFCGVHQQVDYDLSQSNAISVNPNGLVRDRCIESVPASCHFRRNSIRCILNHLVQGQIFAAQADVVAYVSGDIHQVIHKTAQLLNLPAHHR